MFEVLGEVSQDSVKTTLADPNWVYKRDTGNFTVSDVEDMLRANLRTMQGIPVEYNEFLGDAYNEFLSIVGEHSGWSEDEVSQFAVSNIMVACDIKGRNGPDRDIHTHRGRTYTCAIGDENIRLGTIGLRGLNEEGLTRIQKILDREVLINDITALVDFSENGSPTARFSDISFVQPNNGQVFYIPPESAHANGVHPVGTPRMLLLVFLGE